MAKQKKHGWKDENGEVLHAEELRQAYLRMVRNGTLREYRPVWRPSFLTEWKIFLLVGGAVALFWVGVVVLALLAVK